VCVCVVCVCVFECVYAYVPLRTIHTHTCVYVCMCVCVCVHKFVVIGVTVTHVWRFRKVICVRYWSGVDRVGETIKCIQSCTGVWALVHALMLDLLDTQMHMHTCTIITHSTHTTTCCFCFA